MLTVALFGCPSSIRPGIDKSVKHKGVDRRSIGLPGLQEAFALQVLALGKPTVLVLTNGGPLAIDNLVDKPGAIVEADVIALALGRVACACAFTIV